MTIGTWLTKSQAKLGNAGITTARLDCLVLLEDALNTNRTHILTHLEEVLPNEHIKLLDSWIKRRAKHEPLAYIRNQTEFYGRNFYVNYHVLEPRPESETMIDLLRELHLPPHTNIVDIGTGSGALAISAKLELPHANVLAVDVDSHCLKVAHKNAKLLNMSIKFIQSDLTAAIPNEVLDHAVLLCNLPYVPDSFQINPAAMREPRLAIFGGKDGLDLYRRLFAQLTALKSRPAYILTESMPPQHKALAEIANTAAFTIQKADDFIQLFD